MKKSPAIAAMLLAMCGAVPAGAQVSDNNEDGVNKIPAQLAGGA